ncbi:MAG: hypothetical protein ACYCPX_06285 [Acidiferrobacteraceae bacterium]
MQDYRPGGQPVAPIPVIVPPTWNKYEYQSAIVKVWAQAARELCEAEHIVVIGYSLPESDLFFRYLFALGSVGEKPLKTFYVMDPNGAVGHRFQKMLGPGARDRFQHFGHSFGASIGHIRNRFQR